MALTTNVAQGHAPGACGSRSTAPARAVAPMNPPAKMAPSSLTSTCTPGFVAVSSRVRRTR